MTREWVISNRMQERCAGCRFWSDYHQGQQRGECRRFPPSVDAHGSTRFPVTHASDWCGEQDRHADYR